ncbi:MAG: enoyl-CoA hydratase/isomerase family protein [Polaromonas sp.]|nr:enoyl-CoA hydratase/isomerase family protein [Polaromonas sp.]
MSIDFSMLDGGIGHIVINRPQRMNALDVPAKQALGAVWREIAANDACKAVVISGAGDKAFCAGSDIKEMQETGLMADTDTLMAAIPGIGVPLEKPVVAALHGFTVGMGLTMAIHCDFRVAVGTTRFSFPETKHGMLSGVSAVTLPGIVGEAAALDIMLSGRIFDAAEALRMGLIHQLVDGDTAEAALAAALKLARQLAGNSSLAMALTKRLVLADRRRKVTEFAALIDQARIAVTDSTEFGDVVSRSSGAGRM